MDAEARGVARQVLQSRAQQAQASVVRYKQTIDGLSSLRNPKARARFLARMAKAPGVWRVLDGSECNVVQVEWCTHDVWINDDTGRQHIGITSSVVRGPRRGELVVYNGPSLRLTHHAHERLIRRLTMICPRPALKSVWLLWLQALDATPSGVRAVETDASYYVPVLTRDAGIGLAVLAQDREMDYVMDIVTVLDYDQLRDEQIAIYDAYARGAACLDTVRVR